MFGDGFGVHGPASIPGLTDAEVQQIRQHMRQARGYTSPNSGTTMSDRLMGEIAAKYLLPNDVENLLWERRQMQQRMTDASVAQSNKTKK